MLRAKVRCASGFCSRREDDLPTLDAQQPLCVILPDAIVVSPHTKSYLNVHEGWQLAIECCRTSCRIRTNVNWLLEKPGRCSACMHFVCTLQQLHTLLLLDGSCVEHLKTGVVCLKMIHWIPHQPVRLGFNAQIWADKAGSSTAVMVLSMGGEKYDAEDKTWLGLRARDLS